MTQTENNLQSQQDLDEKQIHIPTFHTMDHSPGATLQEINKKQRNNKGETQYLSGPAIFTRCVIIAMGALFFGYSVGVLNLAQDKLNNVYGLDDNLEIYQGVLASSLFFGAIFGSLYAGNLLNLYGERKTSIVCDILVIVFSLFFIIPNYAVAVIIRILLGVILGVNSTLVPYYMNQISPKELSGLTGCLQGVFISTGIFLAICMGQGFPTDDEELENDDDEFWWRFNLTLPILFSAIRLISILCIYRLETPFYYVQQNKQDMAVKALKQIYKQQYVQEQLEQLNEQNKQNNAEQTWKQLFNKENRSLTMLGIYIFGFFQFTGITAVAFYSSTIFEDATGSQETGNTVNLIAMGIFGIIPFLGGELCKRFGRRPLMIWGKVLLSIILLLIGVFTLVYEESNQQTVKDICSILNIILIFAYLIAFNSTVGTAAWMYTGEILSGKQMALAAASYQFSAFLVGLIFPIAQEALGIYTMFIFFAAGLIVGMMFLNPKIKETKGLSGLEIQNLFIAQKPDQQVQQQLKQDQVLDSEAELAGKQTGRNNNENGNKNNVIKLNL